jgi:hypothetical protein
MQILLVLATFISLVSAQTTVGTTTTTKAASTAKARAQDPQFLEVLNAPVERADTPTVKSEDSALKDVLAREEDLRKQLAEAKNALAVKATEAAPGAASVLINRPVNSADEQTTRTALQTPREDQSGALTARLLGSNGLLGLLNPKIMDQREAADKLIPSLNTNPSIAKFQQAQAQALQQPQPQQQFAGRQMPFGQQVPFSGQPQQGAFPYQPQFPVQPQGGFPQGLPQVQPGFQQQMLSNPFSAPAGQFGQIAPQMTGFQNPSFGMGG